MNPEALLKERTQMFKNTYNFEHNKRVPLGCNLWSWMVLDCGYKQSEALKDYSTLEKINREIHERYQFDCYTNLLVRNPFRLTSWIGGGVSWFDDTDEFIQCDDVHFLDQDDEWDMYYQDRKEWLWSRAFPRYVTWNDKEYVLTYHMMKEAMEEYARYLAYGRHMTEMNCNEYGALMYYNKTVQPSMEDFFVFIRGIKQLSLDLRRNKEKLKEGLEIIWNRKSQPVLDAAMKDTEHRGFIAAATGALLAHSILSPKQFGEFYWPQLRRIIDAAVENGQTIYWFAEAAILPYTDYFRDIPKGTLMLHLEKDNIFEFREKLPHIAVAGGMPYEMLGGGTKEQCVDYAKKLIDTLGDGFVLCQDKMISYRNDCKRENLLATLDFARNYTL